MTAGKRRKSFTDKCNAICVDPDISVVNINEYCYIRVTSSSYVNVPSYLIAKTIVKEVYNVADFSTLASLANSSHQKPADI